MKLKDFEKGLHCEKKVQFSKLSSKEGKKRLVMMQGADMIKPYFESHNEKALFDFFARLYKEHEDLYEVPAQRTQAVNASSFMWKRLLDYFSGYELLQANRSLETRHGTIMVHMLLKKGGSYHAVIVRCGKQKLSLRARKPENKPNHSVILSCVKESLDKEYPGITVHLASLKSKKDQSVLLQSYYDKGDEVFCSFKEDLEEMTMNEIIDRNVDVHLAVEKDCSDCVYNGKYCNLAPFRCNKEEEVSGEKEEKKFTDSQLSAIHHVDGPLRISAGPGSGKTASLVARLQHLIDICGIAPYNILMVTFTKSAAAEMKERLIPLVGEQYLPTVCTLHSLATQIIRQTSLEKMPLSKVAQYKTLKAALVQCDTIKGAGTESLYGEFGLLNRCFSAFEYLSDPEKFAKMFPSFDLKEMTNVYELYQEMYQAAGYITFDDVIPLANQVLSADEALLASIRGRFKYIMVDEYQDVDQTQVDLITKIAGDRKNLVVVGDDDQAIYSFRNGSNKFMLSFVDDFSAGETVLADNFRSTDSVVGFNTALIRKNKERIKKEFIAHTKGEKPKYISYLNVEDLPMVIKYYRNKGYAYGDMAIIARGNPVLTRIKNELGDIAVLAKSYLCNDHVFLTLMNALKVSIEEEAEDMEEALMKLLCLHHVEVPMKDGATLRERLLSAYSGDRVFYGAFMEKLDTTRKLVASKNALLLDHAGDHDGCVMLLCELIVEVFKVWYPNENENHPAIEAILCLIDEQGFTNISDMVSYAGYMALIGDDTRLQYIGEDKVTLITGHDSKGHEYKVVIVFNMDDFDPLYADQEEENRRLLYVSTTRAKEELLVCGGSTKQLDALVSFVPDFISEAVEIDSSYFIEKKEVKKP